MMPRAMRRRRALTLVGCAITLVGCGVFVAIMASLHIIRQDLSPVARGMSRYAGSDTLGLATVAFLGWAGALIALAVIFRQAHPATCHGLLVAACGVLAVVITPIGNPQTPVSVTTFHTLGGAVFYVGAVWAMRSCASDRADRQLGRATTVLLALFVLGGLGVPGLARIVGLLQRVVFFLVVSWAIRAAVRQMRTIH
jgi:hypothetical protein